MEQMQDICKGSVGPLPLDGANSRKCYASNLTLRVSDILGDHSDIIADIEEISRNLIFDIHNNRAVNI